MTNKLEQIQNDIALDELLSRAIFHANELAKLNDAAYTIRNFPESKKYHKTATVTEEEALAMEPAFKALFTLLRKDVLYHLSQVNKYYNEYKILEAKNQSRRF